MEELKTLKEIYEQGFISQEEFEQRKTQIIDMLTRTTVVPVSTTVRVANQPMIQSAETSKLLDIEWEGMERSSKPTSRERQESFPDETDTDVSKSATYIHPVTPQSTDSIDAGSSSKKLSNSNSMNEKQMEDYITLDTDVLQFNNNMNHLSEPDMNPYPSYKNNKRKENPTDYSEESQSLDDIIVDSTPDPEYFMSDHDSEVNSYLSELDFNHLELHPLPSLPKSLSSSVSDSNEMDPFQFIHSLSDNNDINELGFDSNFNQIISQQVQIPHNFFPLSSLQQMEVQPTIDINNNSNPSPPIPSPSPLYGETNVNNNSINPPSKKMTIQIEVLSVKKSENASKEKPWVCESTGCNKSFSDSSNLSKHIRTHTLERPYQCKQCDKSFSHKSSLAEHLNTHSGQKPFVCEVCKRSFGQNSNLTRHMRLHTGEKPFKCNVCQKHFSQSSNLKTHQNKIHANVTGQSKILKKEK